MCSLRPQLGPMKQGDWILREVLMAPIQSVRILHQLWVEAAVWEAALVHVGRHWALRPHAMRHVRPCAMCIHVRPCAAM